MQTYLYIHKENTSGPQDRYRGKYPLKHVDYELSRAVALEGVEIYDGWQQDGQTFGHNTQKQIVGATYGIAGAAAGRAIPYVGQAWTAWDVGWYLGENYGISKWGGFYRDYKKKQVKN